MRDAYVICLIIGFSLLVLSVLFELFESVFGAVEAAFHLDFDTALNMDLSFLPLSGVSICSGLITFGGTGLLLRNPWIAGACAYLAAMAVQTLIRRLKKVRNEAMDREELYLCDGRIINTVLPGGLGTVEFNNLRGVSVTFVCRNEVTSGCLMQNTDVVLVDFDGEIAVVKQKDEYAVYQKKPEHG